MIDARFTNRRQGSEWYTCARCGVDYPRAAVRVQNGRVLCMGANSNECAEDQPGHTANMQAIEVPREVAISPLPEETVDL